MNIPCPTCVPCVDPSDPFQNFSSEGADVDHVFCYGSGNGSQLPGPGRNWNVGGCTITWGAVTCFSTSDEGCATCLESNRWFCHPPGNPNIPIPAECDFVPEDCRNTIPIDCVQAAHDCVNGFAGSCTWFGVNCQGKNPVCFIFPDTCIECPEIPEECRADHSQCPDIPESCYLPTGFPGDEDPDDDPTKKRTVYRSNAAYCAAECPDGLKFLAVVPPGRFAAYSQAAADAKAQSHACYLANIRKICLGTLSPNSCCVGDEITATVLAVGRFLDNSRNQWRITAGALPEGVELNRGQQFWGKLAVLHGTPMTAGEYNFTLRCTARNGDFIEKPFTICVVGITPETLPDGTVGTAYSETLTATTCATAPLSWQLAPGNSLPDGLLLDEETGVISGNPTLAGTFNFRIILQTEAT